MTFSLHQGHVKLNNTHNHQRTSLEWIYDFNEWIMGHPARGRVGWVTDCGVRGLGFKSPGSILTSRTETSSLSRVVRLGPMLCTVKWVKKVSCGGLRLGRWTATTVQKTTQKQNMIHSFKHEWINRVHTVALQDQPGEVCVMLFSACSLGHFSSKGKPHMGRPLTYHHHVCYIRSLPADWIYSFNCQSASDIRSAGPDW